MADTPEKLGCSPDGQISSSTNTSSSVESGTNSVKSSAKKYDLGVLFVHGIGKQKAGDTFKGMYEPIKEEFISQNISFREVRKNKLSAKVVVVEGVQSKNIFFKESHWNNSGASRNKSTKGVLEKIGIWILGVIQCALLGIYFLGVALLARFLNKKIVTFASAASISIVLMSFSRNDFGVIKNLLETPTMESGIRNIFLLTMGLIFLAFPAILWNRPIQVFKRAPILASMTLGFILLLIWLYIVNFNIFECVSKIIAVLLVIATIALCIWKKDEISNYWNQINDSADYISTGKDIKYIQRVERDINYLSKRCDRVIIFAHSMGEYLSYASLERLITNLQNEKIHLVSIGGGQGLVTLMGKLKVADGKKVSPGKSFASYCGTAALVAILLFVAAFSLVGFSIDMWQICSVLISGDNIVDFINSPMRNKSVLNTTEWWLLNFGLHFFLIMLLFALEIDNIHFVTIKYFNLQGFEFYRYSHLWDPVGSPAGFFYGDRVVRSITPSGLLGHTIRTYFDSVGQTTGVSESAQYIRIRSLQHIMSLAFDNPRYLLKKYSPNVYLSLFELLTGEFISLYFFAGYRDVLYIVLGSVMVLIPNLFGISFKSWVLKAASVFREYDNHRSLMVADLIIGVLFSTTVTFLTLLVFDAMYQ